MPADICERMIAAKCDEILATAARCSVTNVPVFGSVARREDSGLDLLGHAGSQPDLEDLLGVRVEVAPDRGLKDGYARRW